MNAHAADASTERTTMPDFCSDRNVTCVVPDGAPRVRAVAPTPRNSNTSGQSDSPTVVTTTPRVGSGESANAGATPGAAATGSGRAGADRVTPAK
jgi:hypothetical protein